MTEQLQFCKTAYETRQTKGKRQDKNNFFCPLNYITIFCHTYKLSKIQK